VAPPPPSPPPPPSSPPAPPSPPPPGVTLGQALAGSESSLGSMVMVGGVAAVIFAAVLTMYVAFTRKRRGGRGGGRGGRGRIDPTKQASSSTTDSSTSNNFHDFSIDKEAGNSPLQLSTQPAVDRGQQRAAEMELVSALVNAESMAGPAPPQQMAASPMMETWMQSADQASFSTFGAQQTFNAGMQATYAPGAPAVKPKFDSQTGRPLPSADPAMTMCATFNPASMESTFVPPVRSPREQASRDKFRKRSQGSKKHLTPPGAAPPVPPPAATQSYTRPASTAERASSSDELQTLEAGELSTYMPQDKRNSWFDDLGETLGNTFRPENRSPSASADASPQRSERQNI